MVKNVRKELRKKADAVEDSASRAVLNCRKKALEMAVQIAQIGSPKNEQEIFELAQKLEDWMYR